MCVYVPCVLCMCVCFVCGQARALQQQQQQQQQVQQAQQAAQQAQQAAAQAQLAAAVPGQVRAGVVGLIDCHWSLSLAWSECMLSDLPVWNDDRVD